MADNPELPPPGGSSSIPAAARTELLDVAKKLDILLDLMANSPLFRTPPPPNPNSTNPQPNTNPTSPPPNPDTANPPPSRTHHNSIPYNSTPTIPVRSARVERSRPARNTRREESRESASWRETADTATSGRVETWKKRKAETDSPLSQEILDTEVPEIRCPNLDTYHGKTDPTVFLTVFKAQMLPHTLNDAVKCKILVTTLRSSAMLWFFRQPRGSITSFNKFKKMLVTAFASSKQPRKSNRSLLNLEQGIAETLLEFIIRFNEACLDLKEGEEPIAKLTLEEGLLDGPYRYSIAKNSDWTLDQM